MFTRIYIYIIFGRIPLRIALQDTIHNAHKRAWQTSYEPIKSRYIHHSRMIAPRYHIRPSPALHIPLVFTPGHHVKSLEGFHRYKKLENWIELDQLYCPLWKVGDASFTTGVDQLEGLEDKTLESRTMQTTRITRTPVPRLSIQRNLLVC